MTQAHVHFFSTTFNPLRTGLALTLTAALTACGGGGDSSPTTPTPPTSPSATLTASNYQQVARASVQGSMFLSGTNNIAVSLSGRSASRPTSAALEQVRRISAAGRLRPSAVKVDEFACEVSGKVLLSINDANNNDKLDVGDSFGLEAQDCRDSDTSVSKGKVTITIREVTGDFGAGTYGAKLELKLEGFTEVEGNETYTGDGSMIINVTQSGASNTSTLEVPRLAVTSTQSGVTSTQSMTNVRVSEEYRTDNAGTTIITSVNGTLATTELGGQAVTLETLTPLRALESENFPNVGQMVVSGGGNSRMRITALNKTQVQLELDANGDGTYEDSVVKLWTDLS